MRVNVAFALLLFVFLGAASVPLPYTICDDAPFVPTAVTLDPNPVHVGSSLHFQINGTADHRIEGGTFKADVTYVVHHFSFPVYSEVKDLCDRTTCPIEIGPVAFTYDKALPNVIPKGKYRVKIEAFDLDKHLELCLKVSFRIKGDYTAIVEEGGTTSDRATIELASLGIDPRLLEDVEVDAANEVDARQPRFVN